MLLEIEIQGALEVRRQFPEALLLFLSPPSAEELKRRLVGRGTEDEETVNKRLSRAAEESDGIGEYDYFLINDSLEDCVEAIHRVIEAEKCRVARQKDTIAEITQGVHAFRG